MADDTETLRQWSIPATVIRAIAAAARLLDEHLELIEADLLNPMRRRAEHDGGQEAAMRPTATTACPIVATTLLACAPHVAAGLHVIDGDTIDRDGVRWRLANHDSPKLHGRCAREREIAWKAKHRLEELLRSPYTLQRVSCWHGYPRDRYGRLCAIVRVNGEDVADTS